MRARCALLLGLATGLCPAQASAQAPARTVVVSPAPVATSVTVYRDPGRGEGNISPRWPNGYALISETRKITLPAGDALVRFEGVAGGMIAVSAVVSGLPGAVSEKNRDAQLLSPASLLDGSLGNRVHIRRTNIQTGKMSEEEAVVRSGSDGAVVLETARGVEALQCSGLPEALVYDHVPGGLSARPAFSVQTTSRAATTAQVTLTYLATGFDWGASYVATVAEDGRSLDLFGWMTVANGNDVTYPDARLLAVAGEPHRSSDYRVLGAVPQGPKLDLRCWPIDSTSSHDRFGLPKPPPPPPMAGMFEMAMSAPMAMRSNAVGDIAVTAKRIARQEDLGDLKLYRVPMPVEIAPGGLKQVALLHKAQVPFTRIYGATLLPWSEVASRPLAITLRMQNREKDGLGLPLPSGGAVIMQRRADERLLLADSHLGDRAIGEKVELEAGLSSDLRVEQSILSSSARERRLRITLTSASDMRVPVEIGLERVDGWTITASGIRLIAREDKLFWLPTLSPHGTAQLDYSIARQ